MFEVNPSDPASADWQVDEYQFKDITDLHERGVSSYMMTLGLGLAGVVASYDGFKEWVFGSGTVGAIEMLSGVALTATGLVLDKRFSKADN